MTNITHINREEALRYLGGAGEPDERMLALLDEAEAALLKAAKPKYLYRVTDLPCDWLSQGEDIKKHLADCDRAVVLCATLGAEADRLIRVSQISDMPRAVVIDALASAMTEQVCAEVDRLLAEQMEGCYFTYRFSPGYGDYPIELQREFLRFLDAPRKIGLTVTESFLLTPAKSVTAVAGISAEPVPRGRRGCAVCSLRDTCAYRRKGSHCGFQNLT